MKVRIVVDSVADVKKEIAERLSVVPLNINFGDEQYVDGETMTKEQFYQKLATSSDMPRTSQPSPAAFVSVYEEAKKAGESLVVLTVSSKLSGTYQSAMIAAQDYQDNVFVVDTQHVALGEGVLAEYALQLADSGMDAAAIAAEIEREKENVCLFALVDTLEYLKRGGRISKTVAFAGGLLSIKPLVSIKDGALDIAGKARGTKQGNALLNREIEQTGGIDFSKPVLAGYTGTSDELLKKYIADSQNMWQGREVYSTLMSGVVGTHAGPNAVVVSYFKNK